MSNTEGASDLGFKVLLLRGKKPVMNVIKSTGYV